ncbi:MAG: metal-dependent hydrolase [Proteobacteria bacterium]|nr:metal-dependent hydrolase [Pseudomonadota bacterium]MBU1611009.1 metal-dependent hydrolase [Pseudomonadota bacterium]
MELTWFGHSNFKIAFGDHTLVIDPFFDGNPTAPIPATDIGAVDLVLITHDHGDHVGQAIEICQRTRASLVGVFDTVNHLIEEGLPDQQGIGMNLGGTIEQLGVQIKMVQAMHSTRTGAATGYIMTFPDGYCLYHAGDTSIFQSMELFKVFHKIDLALLPVGGWFTMDPRQAAYACRLLGCKAVVPMHWGTFPILEQNTDTFRDALKEFAPDVVLKVLTPGTPVQFG